MKWRKQFRVNVEIKSDCNPDSNLEALEGFRVMSWREQMNVNGKINSNCIPQLLMIQ